ncbi:unnamed protein product [Rhizophagus irregularis]|uniref:Uncharacterized protein n=1 Tax=Rhizophagus irregularis TaxID=588596 RepID=A0A915YW48_9GLOM|nr:unnamed protein product [Rhizophagus irregularis]CAB5349362.1 unnamed protein product [Rhizophagus irregularis]
MKATKVIMKFAMNASIWTFDNLRDFNTTRQKATWPVNHLLIWIEVSGRLTDTFYKDNLKKPFSSGER